MELLERSGVQIAGKRAVVVGRSNIVGTPAAQLLQRRDATVTVVHSRTPDGAAICREADIVIAACGRAGMLTGDWIKPGAVVIDVGINAVPVSLHACLRHLLVLPVDLGWVRLDTVQQELACGETSFNTDTRPTCLRVKRSTSLGVTMIGYCRAAGAGFNAASWIQARW